MRALRFIPDSIGRLGIGGLQPIGLGLSYTQRVQALAPLVYWPLNEVAGTSGANSVIDYSGNARTGTTANVTFGAAGIGDGNTAATFNGTSAEIAIVSQLQPAYAGRVGSFAAWCQVSGAAVWTDSTNREVIRLLVDGSNYIIIRRATTNNSLEFLYNAGGTTKTVVATLSSTAWFHVALTFNKTGDELKAYINGAQVGTTQTGLGTFTTSNYAGQFIGSGASGEFWKGNLAHAALFAAVLTDAQIASLAVV